MSNSHTRNCWISFLLLPLHPFPFRAVSVCLFWPIHFHISNIDDSNVEVQYMSICFKPRTKQCAVGDRMKLNNFHVCLACRSHNLWNIFKVNGCQWLVPRTIKCISVFNVYPKRLINFITRRFVDAVLDIHYGAKRAAQRESVPHRIDVKSWISPFWRILMWLRVHDVFDCH